jgi:hypothetical protein
MDARDLFLMQYAAVHGDSPASAATRTFGGLTDDQMKVRPRPDLNSIAWVLWHFTRAEDIMFNPVLNNRAQVLDDAWMKKLNVSRKDFGIGMKTDEVTALTNDVNVGALREYRAAVSARTKEIVGAMKDADWAGSVEPDMLQRGLAQGGFGEGLAKAFGGRPKVGIMSGIGLFHGSGHMGEAVTIRSAGGFGTGV